MGQSNSKLYAVVYALCDTAFKNLTGVKRDQIIEVVQEFAIYSAASGIVANVVPEAGGLLAAATQTALVWTLYVKINKIIGLEMSESTAKFIGSAMLTNIALNAGSFLVGYASAVVVSFIPVFGQFASAAIEGTLGYILIYVSAVLYLVFLTAVFKAKGKIEITGDEGDKNIINGIIKDTNLKDLIKEAKDSYKEAKKRGDIDRATKNLKCPVCGKPVDSNQTYCTHCGSKIK